MAKNNKLVNQYKMMFQQIQNITPSVYASIAIALHRSGVEFEVIEALFELSQEIWNECVKSDINMWEMCLEETGIDVQRQVSE